MSCLNCNAELIQVPKKRVKLFCNSTCRSNYWQKNKRIKNLPKKETKPPDSKDGKKELTIEEFNLLPLKEKLEYRKQLKNNI